MALNKCVLISFKFSISFKSSISGLLGKLIAQIPYLVAFNPNMPKGVFIFNDLVFSSFQALDNPIFTTTLLAINILE